MKRKAERRRTVPTTRRGLSIYMDECGDAEIDYTASVPRLPGIGEQPGEPMHGIVVIQLAQDWFG